MDVAEQDQQIEKMFWRGTDAAGAEKAIGHAWVEFMHCPAGLVIEVNQKPALRISIKYRDTGPYLSVEVAPGSGETMGTCIRTADMVTHYEKILQAHNALGDCLHSGRQFLLKPIAESAGENGQ